MTSHRALENPGTDLGDQWWFRLLVGVLWTLVGVLTAVGIYSLAPGAVANIPNLLVGSLVFVGLLVAVVLYVGRVLSANYRPQQRF
jgi:hypothetical protein